MPPRTGKWAAAVAAVVAAGIVEETIRRSYTNRTAGQTRALATGYRCEPGDAPVVQTLRRRHAEPIRCWAWDVPAFRDMPAMKLTAERSSERVTLLRAFWYGIDLKGRATKQHEGANTSPLQRALSAHACDVAANAEFQFVISVHRAVRGAVSCERQSGAVDESKSPCGFSPP